MSSPWGLPSLSDKDALQLSSANTLVRHTLSIIRVAEQCKAPWLLENPHSSLLWHLSEFEQISRRSHVQQVRLHMCGFGTPWKKATRLLCSRVSKASELERVCATSPEGLCGFSGHHHVRLQGRDRHGVSWTHRAQEYPPRFARQVAAVLVEAGREQEFAQLCRGHADRFKVLTPHSDR